MTNILIGCDPEVFVKQNGVFKSAYKLIKGTKEKPFKVRNGAVQVDGMALEFNINPAKDEDEFCFNVQDVLQQMCKMVPQYEVVATPVAHFEALYLKQQPPEATELGCTPDFNGWAGVVNEKPNSDLPMRTASGHIHIGWTSGENVQSGEHQHRVNMMAQQMDFYLGLGSVLYDDDVQRRSMYGKAGCLRYKPYGGEYRTLSNAWLANEGRMRWVYRNAVKGMQELMSGNFLPSKYGDIQDIINTSNRIEAEKLMKKAGLEVCYA